MVGYKCNFSCAHCITADKKECLSPKEVDKILTAIEQYRINSLHFVGGETTLYTREINDILSRVPHLSNTRVRITTNGHFARTVNDAIKTLRTLRRLDYVELSYDKFHREFLPKQNIANLYKACKKLGKHLGVLFAIQSPLDLVLLKDIRSVGSFPILIQHVLPFGAAKNNNVAWRNKIETTSLWRRHCPTKKKLIYMCGQGFTICCSALTLGTNSRRFLHKTPQEHFESDFYRLMSTCSMGRLKKQLNIDGAIPENKLVSTCTLCEYLFNTKYKLAKV